MIQLFTIFYPFGNNAWAFGAQIATDIVRGKGTRTELWIEFRWPNERATHFHRLHVPLGIIKQ